MLLIGGDTTKFNTFVKGFVESLSDRQETTTYLMTNRFKVYLPVEDKTFHAYTNWKEEWYQERGTQDVDFLMNLDNKKFTLLKYACRYNIPSVEKVKSSP